MRKPIFADNQGLNMKVLLAKPFIISTCIAAVIAIFFGNQLVYGQPVIQSFSPVSALAGQPITIANEGISSTTDD